MALSTQRALPSLLSPESVRHDVFLSFTGRDCRRGFISHLCLELQLWQAIKTFTDEDLEIGAPIRPALFSAIEQSLLAIVVLSPNYATSTWCLDELAKIVETMETRKNAILPVFLDVDPFDVLQSFAEAFAKHEEKFSHDIDKVGRWRAALTKVANLSGWDSKNYKCESELIQVIVSSLAEAFVTREELFRHDIDKVETWAVANISTNYDGMEKGITKVLEKVLQVDGLGLIHENKLKKFQEHNRHMYIRCLAKVLFCVDLGNGIRELAGLLLRNELKNAYDANVVVEQHLWKWIKQKLLAIICSPGGSVPRSTFQVISEHARNMLKCWPQLTTLIECSLHNEQLLTPAVLETLGYVSEKIGPNGGGTVRKIFQVLVRGMNVKNDDSVCLAATKAMYYALSFAEINFFDDMEVILEAILETVGSSNPNIEQAAYECFIVLPSRLYCNSGLSRTYLVNIMEITTKAVRGRNSIQAFQFWISICEAEIDILKINSRGSYQGRYLIRDNLKDLIALLLPLFHREEIELLDEKACEFDISLRLCVGYIAQAVGKHVESFTEAVELFIDARRATGYNYLAEVIAIIVDFFVSDIFGDEVSEVNKRVDLTEGGKKGKAANEMERGEGSQKPEKPDKEKGLGQCDLLSQMLRIVGGLLKQDCDFLHEIFTETVTRYSANMRDACGHYIESDVFSYLRETRGDDLLRKFVNSWHSPLCMIKFLSVFFSDRGRHSGELMMFQMNELQTFGLSWILLLIFPNITNAMTELIDLATKEDEQIDRKLFVSVEQIYVHHGLKGSNKNEASARCAESIVKFCEKLLERDDDEIREQLEIVGVVSKYFIDIDHFTQFYFKTLGSRIHCVDWEQEKRRLTMVRKMLFGGKLNNMKSLDNLEASVNDTALDAQKFKEFFVNKPVNLATVFVGPHWPSEDLSFENIIFPEELAKELAKTDEVGREFLKQHSRPGASRKFVKMIHPLSSCTTECMFGTETIKLDMSIAQATLLMYFETADTWTFSDLLPKLGITHEELVSLIHSLSQENSKLLIKEPNTENILPTDRFKLNTNFTFTSPIPLPVLEDKRRKNVLERDDNDMSYTICCMLMKIMKQCKDSGPVDREKLADAAIVRCAGLKNCRFVPTNEAIDNCIESLIKSKDLLVDENDPNKLRWNL